MIFLSGDLRNCDLEGELIFLADVVQTHLVGFVCWKENDQSILLNRENLQGGQPGFERNVCDIVFLFYCFKNVCPFLGQQIHSVLPHFFDFIRESYILTEDG